MKKLTGMVVLAVAILVTTSAVVAQEVYLLPQQSTAAYRSTANVEIWVDAANFQGGQINLTYDSECADVTDWARNTTNFQMGGREHYTGKDWITFTALNSLAGEYLVGTFTVQCVNEQEEGGETVLAFAEPSELFDAKGNPVAVDWRAGTFKCLGSTSAAITQTSSGGGSGAMKTETQKASPASKVTQGMTAAAPAASTITPIPAATTSPTVSAFVSPTHSQSPEEEKEVPGFEGTIEKSSDFLIYHPSYPTFSSYLQIVNYHNVIPHQLPVPDPHYSYPKLHQDIKNSHYTSKKAIATANHLPSITPT